MRKSRQTAFRAPLRACNPLLFRRQKYQHLRIFLRQSTRSRHRCTQQCAAKTYCYRLSGRSTAEQCRKGTYEGIERKGCCNNAHHILDYIALIAVIAVIFGVVYIIYLNKIHEKEIATRCQKNFSFGMTVDSGLAGAIIGIFQIVLYAAASSELVWAVIGGFLNFAFGLTIFLSFKKGIFMK